MKKIRVYVVEPGGDITRIMLKDLEDIADVTVIFRPYEFPNATFAKIKKYHFHYKINKFLQLPLKRIWNKYSVLHNISFEEEYYNVILFNSFALQEYSVQLILDLKKRYPNIYLALYFSDTIASPVIKKAVYMSKKIPFDLIYSFDPVDSFENGYIYTTAIYSKYNVTEMEQPQNDLFFVGENKGRISMLNSIYAAAVKNGLVADFRILRVRDDEKIDGTIKYNSRITYLDCLSELQNSKCILDIVQEGQTGTTLRYYEAVCYNKKLLTNNKSLSKMKYYNSSYIQIFDTVEDIDWEWVKKEDAVNYNYDNDYSPVNLVNDIINRLNKE